MLKDTLAEFIKSTAIDLQSMQYLAAVKVAITVCESEDVQYMIGRFHKTKENGPAVGYLDGQWRQLRCKVKRKLNQIDVPELIIDIVLENLWPISYEVSKWILYHVEDTGFDCSSKFFWTPQANIDYVKTAEFLVRNQTLDIKKRFKLACIYCLDSEVRSLWEQMNLPERRSFFVRGNLKNSNQNPIVLYWTYYIQEVSLDYWGSKALNNTELFKYAADNGYLPATKFFLGILRNNLRNRLFYNYLSKLCNKLHRWENIGKDNWEIACLFACEASSDYDPMDLYITLYLRYFLEWPMQKLFMSVVHRIGRQLDAKTFGEVLDEILKKDNGGFKDYNYKELFMEFWHQGSLSYKTYVRVESGVGYKMILKFVKKHFGFVLEENSFAMKARFRAHVLEPEISENEAYFEKENVEFFKFLVRECLTTSSSIDRFSEIRFMVYLFPKSVMEEYFNLPLGELKYLIDGIMRSV